MSSTTPIFASLEEAAKDVIAILKDIPEFAGSEIAIIGGMALWKYVPDYRTTDDVDFVITSKGAPKSVKEKLLKDHSDKFEDLAGKFVYKTSTGANVQIDMCSSGQTPFIPDTVQTISTLEASDPLPYINVKDLLVFKISSCGLRPTAEKKKRDADDAAVLLQFLTSGVAAFELNDLQKKTANEGLEDVVGVLGEELKDWKKQLGIVVEDDEEGK